MGFLFEDTPRQAWILSAAEGLWMRVSLSLTVTLLAVAAGCRPGTEPTSQSTPDNPVAAADAEIDAVQHMARSVPGMDAAGF